MVIWAQIDQKIPKIPPIGAPINPKSDLTMSEGIGNVALLGACLG